MAFELEQVIGSGSVQELICQTIKFHVPVEEIKEIRKTVIVDNCMTTFDKVIINGRLRKDIMFKKGDTGFPVPGTVQGCIGITTTVSGPIFDTDIDIAFNALIPVPGAEPGDKCAVLQAFVEGEKEEPAEIRHTGVFTALIDKSIVFLCVKVVRDVITNNVGAGAGANQEVPLCPPRRSTGFFPGGNGTIPAPRPGPLPGSWIGPTLLFPGVLNPGIPTAIPPANIIVAPSPSQVQIAPAVSPPTPTGDATTATGGTVIQ